jgi:Cu/Ag efflux pump CusA
MTFERQVTWSSHLVRRLLFMILLPIAGVAYTIASPGIGIHFMIPICFAAVIGFLSNLAIAECHGLIMETYDTCDLQPGVNSKHRLRSLAESVKRRRTAYTSFPRVSAGIFVSQAIGFLVAAAATGVGGAITRDFGAQVSTGVTAGILMALTLLLSLALWRFKMVQVIPNHISGTRTDMADWGIERASTDDFWKPVIIGNPSGKTRRVSLLELGHQSRWTEIRRLNKLL